MVGAVLAASGLGSLPSGNCLAADGRRTVRQVAVGDHGCDGSPVEEVNNVNMRHFARQKQLEVAFWSAYGNTKYLAG